MMGPVNLKIDKDIFFERYYEKKPYLVKGALDTVKFNWEVVDNSLYGWDPIDRQILLYKDGPVDESNFIERYQDISVMRSRIVKDSLYEYMKSGATLVLNKINHRSPKINDICRAISQFVGERVNANAYAAFGGEGSFGTHWDTHDVFAVQLIGRKRWRIFDPTFPKPLSNHHSKDKKSECPETPYMDIVLEEGDVLYLPRGWWHDADPIPGQETLHIAVGCFSPKIIDYLLWVCGNHITEYESARTSMNKNWDSKEAFMKVSEIIHDALSSEDLKESFHQAIEEADRVPSRFMVSELAENSKAKEIEYFQINSSFSPDLEKHSTLINGFKVNMDNGCKSLFEKLLPAQRDEVEKCNVTEKEDRLLKKLAALDVIDISWR